MTGLEIGDRVRFEARADYLPYALVEPGEMGTVVWTDGEGNADIRLDTTHAKLAQHYRNCVWLLPDGSTDAVRLVVVQTHKARHAMMGLAASLLIIVVLAGAAVVGDTYAVLDAVSQIDLEWWHAE
jgi:hypothetical protein